MNNNEEVLKLKAQIAELEMQIKELSPRNGFAYLCQLKPIASIRFDQNTGVWYYSRERRTAWEHMVRVAKELFLSDTDVHANSHGYMPACCTKHKKIASLTAEQQKHAAKFLDEIIVIFNKYFKEANPSVVVNGTTITLNETSKK